MEKYKQYIDNPDYEFVPYNAQVEKEENAITPNGDFMQFSGKSHELGGVNTSLQPGTMIFSDKLKMNGKTFAQLNKTNNTAKEDSILNSNKHGNLSKKTAELMKVAKQNASNKLFNQQESLKQDKVNNYAKRIGLNTVESQNVDITEGFANGGRFMGINPEHKGYCTPMTKSTCTPHRKALAMTLKKHHGFHEHENGGFQPFPTMDNPYHKFKGTIPMYPNGGSNDGESALGDAGMFLAQNAGNIYNLSRYNKPEVEAYERAKASYLDPSAALRDADMENRRAEIGLRNASGGNAASYLSNRTGLATQNLLNKDRIRQQYANQNAGIANQFNMYNTGLSQQEVIANAQNRARTRSGKGEAIGNIGYNTANLIKDKRLDNMDQATLDLMMKYYNTPEFQKIMKENKFKNNFVY